jgi:hypothetical protein
VEVIEERDESALMLIIPETPTLHPRIVLFQGCAVYNLFILLFSFQRGSLHFLRVASVRPSLQPKRALPSYRSYSRRKRTIPSASLQP